MVLQRWGVCVCGFFLTHKKQHRNKKVVVLWGPDTYCIFYFFLALPTFLKSRKAF